MGSCCGIQNGLNEKLLEQQIQTDEEERKRCRKVFDLYDYYQNGTISIDNFESVVYLLGFNPSKKTLENISKDVLKNSCGSIDFESFMSYIPKLLDQIQLSQRKIQVKNSQKSTKFLKLTNKQIQQIKESLKDISSKGFIETSVLHLKNLMSEQGYSPTEGELQEIVQVVQSTQKFEVDDFLKFLNDRIEMQRLA